MEKREDLADDNKSRGKKTLLGEETLIPWTGKVRFVVLSAIDKQSPEALSDIFSSLNA